jgi:predicted enzyme related to lactoylglutathione lyase
MILSECPVKNRVGGVFVHVTDMPRAVAFYGKLLDRPVTDRHDAGNIYVVPTDGGSDLILDANNRHLFRPHGKPVFMFVTHDVDAAYADVRAKGIPIAWEIERHGDVAFFTFLDPDGNMLMACQ